jgi:hypothetical protein
MVISFLCGGRHGIIRSTCVQLLSAAALAAVSFAADSPDAPAPIVDRVGLPKA